MNSDDSISWHAHREAESLSDSSMVDELAEYLTHERDKNRRGAAYFILGKLSQKVRGRDCASILLSRLHHEKNKYVSKPRNIDLGPVFGLLNDGRLIVRHSAIRALSRTDSPEAEDQLIDLLKATSEQNDMVYCQATLNEIGTTKSIPYLRKNLSSRKRDVKTSAQLAIEAIESRAKKPVV